MKLQGKLNMHIMFESVLMLLTENSQNWSMLVEAQLTIVGMFFETQCRARCSDLSDVRN